MRPHTAHTAVQQAEDSEGRIEKQTRISNFIGRLLFSIRRCHSLSSVHRKLLLKPGTEVAPVIT
jgi:hypothetical protein